MDSLRKLRIIKKKEPVDVGVHGVRKLGTKKGSYNRPKEKFYGHQLRNS